MQHAMHMSYCHMWTAQLYYIFQHHLINGTIFEKVIECKICVLILITTFISHISHSKKNCVRYD